MNYPIVKPTVAAFEVTGRCPLACRHCRAAAVSAGTDPLDTAACKAILKGLADYTRCVLIFTGGEPMMRADIFDLVAYARSLGLRPVMASCGEGLDRDAMVRLKEAGILSFSFSLDGPDAATHDAFRQSDGAFTLVMSAVEAAKSVGIRFQINTTLTRLNTDAIDKIAELAVSLGAACWNPFVLVPVGRGEAIRDLLFEPTEYEAVLERLAGLKTRLPIDVRLTCGPQFARVARQKKIPAADKIPGCLAATEFVFISRTGDVQTCGFLDQSAGNLVAEGFDFGRIWERSPLLSGLRDHGKYQGACGSCGYLDVCRGCRARALTVRGDVYAEDPICRLTQPNRPSSIVHRQSTAGKVHSSPFQQSVLSVVQDPLPLCDRPFQELAATLHTTEDALLGEIRRLKTAGFIRRFRPQLNYRALGRTAVLAAAEVPEDRLEKTAAAVSTLSGVSHNYQRDARFNLWFTLQGTSTEEIEARLDRLRQSTGLPFYSFAAEVVYKLNVRFDPAGPGPDWFLPVVSSSGFSLPNHHAEACTTNALTCDEKQAVEAIQQELPLVARPFDELLKTAGGASPVSLLQSLSDKGVLNKVAAVLDYTRLGYTANAMFCAVVDPSRIDAIGRELARIPAVTHCYRRRTCADWPYALYAMLHADTLDRIDAFVRTFAAEWSIIDYRLLPTVREFKKSPVPISFQ